MLLGFLALHLVVGAAVLSAGRGLGRRGLLIGGIAPALTIVWVAVGARDVLNGNAVTQRADWVPQLSLALDLRLDAFALLMTILVSGIGTLVFV